MLPNARRRLSKLIVTFWRSSTSVNTSLLSYGSRSLLKIVGLQCEHVASSSLTNRCAGLIKLISAIHSWALCVGRTCGMARDQASSGSRFFCGFDTKASGYLRRSVGIIIASTLASDRAHVDDKRLPRHTLQRERIGNREAIFWRNLIHARRH